MSRNLDFTNVGDGFRAGPDEWGAFSIFLEICKLKGSGTIFELGASQGLWCVPFARFMQKHGNLNGLAIAIEASDSKSSTLDFWNTQKLHFSVDESTHELQFKGDNWDCFWLNYAFTSEEGHSKFPHVDVRKDNGASIKTNTHVGHRKKTIKVKNVTAQQLSKRFESWLDDYSAKMIHIDLQGSEEDLLIDSNFIEFLLKFDIILIGTHSRLAEMRTFEILHSKGLNLIKANPSLWDNSETPILIQDGEQVWVSDSKMDYLKELKFLDLKSCYSNLLSYSFKTVISKEN